MASQGVNPFIAFRDGSERRSNVFLNVPLFGDPGDFAPGGVQLGLEIGGRAGADLGHRFGPGVGGGKTLSAGIEPVGQQPQFPGYHRSRLAMLSQFRTDGFAFEGFIEFTADFYRTVFMVSSIRSNLSITRL
jgi:hypothetical protein